MIEKLTNKELKDLTQELEDKYQKILKLAKKVASELDSIHTQYVEVQKELNKRKIEN